MVTYKDPENEMPMDEMTTNTIKPTIVLRCECTGDNKGSRR